MAGERLTQGKERIPQLKKSGRPPKQDGCGTRQPPVWQLKGCPLLGESVRGGWGGAWKVRAGSAGLRATHFLNH